MQSVQPGEAVVSAPSGYAATWALFNDWCDVTGNTPLPADPVVVAKFLAGCPAAAATQRRRVTAIDHHHTATGYAPPGKSAAVLAALGRPTGESSGPAVEAMAAVDAALRLLPSHGWTHGVFGRRDRCLLVLSQLALVPYRHLATLTAGDIALVNGTATIRAAQQRWTVRPGADPVVCGPCTIVGWLEVLQVVVTRISTSAVADLLGHADPVTVESPHVCRSGQALGAAAVAVPLLPPINQWGALPFPHPRLTSHAASRRTRDLLAGDIVVHRTLPFPGDQPTPALQPAEQIENPAATFGEAAARRAWSKRRDELNRLSDVGDVLSVIDRQIAELQHRVETLLDAETT